MLHVCVFLFFPSYILYHITCEIFVLLNKVQISQYAKGQLIKFFKTRQLNRLKVYCIDCGKIVARMFHSLESRKLIWRGDFVLSTGIIRSCNCSN